MFKANRLDGRADLLADSEKLDAMARDSRLIQRASHHFSAAAFLLTLLQAVAGNTPQLRNLASRISGWLDRTLSKQAIAKRFGDVSSGFLLRVINTLLTTGKLAPPPDLLARFKRIILQDSTQFAFHKRMAGEFPAHGNHHGATSGCKLDFAFDLRTHRALRADLWPATTQDKELGKDLLDLLEPGDLLLRDMGYFHIDSFALLSERGIHWISRLPANVGVVLVDGMTLEKRLASEKGNRLELDVLLGKARHPARLIGLRADKATTQQRQRELRAEAKKRGGKASSDSLARAGWHLLLTNLPLEMATIDELCLLYGLRWRIETLFRSWKRDKQWTTALRHISNRYHVEALVLAGIIQGLLAMTLVFACDAKGSLIRLSLEKLHDTLRQRILTLKPQAFVIELPDCILKHLKLECRRRRQSTLDQMLAALG